MSRFEEAHLQAYLDGELLEWERLEVERELAASPDLRRKLDGLRALEADVSLALGRIERRPDLARARAVVERRTGRRTLSARKRALFGGLAVFAITAGAVLAEPIMRWLSDGDDAAVVEPLPRVPPAIPDSPPEDAAPAPAAEPAPLEEVGIETPDPGPGTRIVLRGLAPGTEVEIVPASPGSPAAIYSTLGTRFTRGANLIAADGPGAIVRVLVPADVPGLSLEIDGVSYLRQVAGQLVFAVAALDTVPGGFRFRVGGR